VPYDVLQGLARDVVEKPLRLSVEPAVQVRLDADREAALLSHAHGQPVERRHEPEVVEQRRPNGVGERPRLPDRLVDDPRDRTVVVLAEPRLRGSKMKLDRRERLDKPIVEPTRDPPSLLILAPSSRFDIRASSSSRSASIRFFRASIPANVRTVNATTE